MECGHPNFIPFSVGLQYSRENTAAIKEYIANQLKQDKESDQLSLFDMKDPFKGGK